MALSGEVLRAAAGALQAKLLAHIKADGALVIYETVCLGCTLKAPRTARVLASPLVAPLAGKDEIGNKRSGARWSTFHCRYSGLYERASLGHIPQAVLPVSADSRSVSFPSAFDHPYCCCLTSFRLKTLLAC